MNAIECLRERRSVRAFEGREIPREILVEIADVARYAPTARNVQPWKCVVVTDKVMRSRIAELTDHGKFIADAPACIAVFCEDTKYYLEDGSAATTYILLAAKAFGIGSCWVAGDKKHYCQDIMGLLGVPPGFRLVSLIAMGYSKAGGEREKRPLADVLRWEQF
ncbi:MAG: nitroreductase family protein [archaeon]